MRWSVPYVLVVTVLGYDAFSAEPALWWVGEMVAFALLTPLVAVELPVIYLVGAAAWNVREGMPGQPMWPVTLTFTCLFFLAAVLNAIYVRHLWRLFRGRSRPRRPPAPER